jgi:hypothetical protein
LTAPETNSSITLKAWPAVRSACPIRDAEHRIRLEIRAGVDTGELGRRDRSVGGRGVDIGRRAAAPARAAEVLVTGQGCGDRLRYIVRDRCAHTSKGVVDP